MIDDAFPGDLLEALGNVGGRRRGTLQVVDVIAQAQRDVGLVGQGGRRLSEGRIAVDDLLREDVDRPAAERVAIEDDGDVIHLAAKVIGSEYPVDRAAALRFELEFLRKLAVGVVEIAVEEILRGDVRIQADRAFRIAKTRDRHQIGKAQLLIDAERAAIPFFPVELGQVRTGVVEIVARHVGKRRQADRRVRIAGRIDGGG